MTSAAFFLLTAIAQAPVATSGAVVSGYVLHASTRAPLADATVTLLPPPDRIRLSPSAWQLLSVTTDANGRFAFEGVPGQSYVSRARKAGYVDGGRGRATRPLTVAASGRVDGIDLFLEPSGVIVGRVVDASGAPIERAMVMALRGSIAAVSSARTGQGDAAPTAMRPAAVTAGEQTNAHGEFRLDEIPAGEYYLRAVPPIAPRDGGQTVAVSRTLVRTYYPNTMDQADAVAVSVVSGIPVDVGALVMLTAEGFRITGRVVDETGRGVANVMIRLVPAAAPPTALPMTTDRAETDADGAFALDGILAGDYALVAVPALLLRTDADPSASPTAESMSFVLGGIRSESARGSVWTESQNGVRRQYRDELGTRQQVVVDADVPNLHIVVRSVPVP